MVPLLIVIGLLLLSALFSSSELAIMGVPIYKVKKFLKEHPHGHAKADLLLSLRARSERTLIAILIGNNLVNVALSVYAARLGDTLLGSVALSGATAFVMISVTITFLILFFGEIIPKVFATRYALRFALVMAPIIQGVIYLLFPFVYLLEVVIHGLQRFLGGVEDRVSKEDVDIFVEEGKKEGIFSSTEALIIHNFLEFRDRAVESVLRHRTELFALDEKLSLSTAIKQILSKPHSRIPVYRDDKDQIVGLLTLRDALRLYVDASNRDKSLRSFGIRQAAKVPITASIFDVFLQMKKSGQHFAVVIDEYGGTAGIVTFEDILEDLVGAIRDESDQREEGEIIKVDDLTVKVRGDVVLRDVIDVLGLTGYRIPERHVEELSEEETVSYIILYQLKTFAKQGDLVSLGELCLEVLKTNSEGDKIERVQVRYGEGST